MPGNNAKILEDFSDDELFIITKNQENDNNNICETNENILISFIKNKNDKKLKLSLTVKTDNDTIPIEISIEEKILNEIFKEFKNF